MSEPLLFGDCHTHLDQYGAAELPGLVERVAEAGVSTRLDERGPPFLEICRSSTVIVFFARMF